MNARNYTLISGIAFLIIGLMGLFGIGLMPHGGHPAPDIAVNAQYGRLLGLFPVNILHNLFHTAIGIWGVSTYRTVNGPRVYCRSLAIIYGVLTIMGLFPVLNTTFGLIPIYGHDIWLHAVAAATAAYFGWVRYSVTAPGTGKTVIVGRH